MALRGSGSAVHSTALMRLYSGRVRFSSVTKARTVCSLSGSQADDGTDLLAHLLDDALLDVGALAQQLLQLFGADVLAAVQDDAGSSCGR